MADTTKKADKPEPTLLEKMQAAYPDKDKAPEPCADCPNAVAWGTDEKKG